jgi:hypothetical protein
MVATIRLVGTLGVRGAIELHGANGVQANGVIEVRGDDFKAAMFNLAPLGKVFTTGVRASLLTSVARCATA